MRRIIEIISSSFRMALQELWKNKLRTFLSLFGITIGIFCIIGVLSTVQSLEYNLQQEIKSLGTNTIYIDKWEYGAGGGPDYPWWKYVKRPVPKYEELKPIKERTPIAEFAAFKIQVNDNVEVNDNIARVNIYGITDEFTYIQPVEIAHGRYITDAEFETGANAIVVGNEIAEKLYGDQEYALGKSMTIRGKKCTVVGVIKKQGQQMLGGWQFDQSVVTPYRFARTIMDEFQGTDPLILVKGRDGISSKELQDDLRGTMRSIHKLSPTESDDFALNDVNDFSDLMSQAFVSVNVGGWAIAALSLIVGMFGVANIMFVTVKERTPQIGLKKAIGAKRAIILTEFLAESAFLCIIGGLIGILLVFGLTKIISSVFHFPIFISTPLLLLAVFICIIVGLLAGIIPAYQASKMDPVVAIRS